MPATFILRDNRIVFFADALDANNLEADIESLFIEEVVIHSGLRQLLGPEFTSTMVSLYDVTDVELLGSALDIYEDTLRDVNGDRVTGEQVLENPSILDENSKAIIMEEFFGRIAEQDPTTLLPRERTLLQRVMDFVQSALRRLGFLNVGTFENELRNLLVLSAENLRRGNVDGVGPATERLRVAAETDQRRVGIIRLFADTITSEETAQVINAIVPERLVNQLRSEGIQLDPTQNLETLQLVTQRININTAPARISPDVFDGDSGPFDRETVENAEEEILNGAVTLQTFSGVVDAGLNTPERVEALFDQAVGNLLRERAPDVLSSRGNVPPELNILRNNFNVGNFISTRINAGIPTTDEGLFVGTQLRSVAARFSPNQGWARLTPIVNGVNIEFRPVPYTFERFEGRENVESREGWIRTLASRLEDAAGRVFSGSDRGIKV
jgi:hypothetical protein